MDNIAAGVRRRRYLSCSPRAAANAPLHTRGLLAGLVRVRHYGLLANRGRAEKLEQCRRLLWQAGLQQRLQAAVEAAAQQQGPRLCPACGVGTMEGVELLPARAREGLQAGLGQLVNGRSESARRSRRETGSSRCALDDGGA